MGSPSCCRESYPELQTLKEMFPAARLVGDRREEEPDDLAEAVNLLNIRELVQAATLCETHSSEMENKIILQKPLLVDAA